MRVNLLLSGHLSGLVGLVPPYIAGAALLLLAITFPLIKVIEGSRHIVPQTICTLLALMDFICGAGFLFINISVMQELNQGVGASFGGVMACSFILSTLLLCVSIRTFRRKWRASMANEMDDVA